MQAELQSEDVAAAEGEDSVVEAAAVTGVLIRNCHVVSWQIFLQMSMTLHCRIFGSVVYQSCS